MKSTLNLHLTQIRSITTTGERTAARGRTEHGSRNSGPLGSALALGQRKRIGRIARKVAGSRRSGGTSLNPRKGV
jgi:hypothetical protein